MSPSGACRETTDQKTDSVRGISQTKKARNGGFKIGKKKFGSKSFDSGYLGKAQKIKQTLIHKAKLKKQRAKELIRAGYQNEGESRFNGSADHQTNHNFQKLKKFRGDPSLTQTERSKDEIVATKNNHHNHRNRSDDPSLSTSNQNEQDKKPSRKSITDGARSKARSTSGYHHSNGQPRLSHKVNKILCKLQDS
ncbi:hypothetical protein BY996DRAFT_6413435 [Phakopsora pachyrhizi]|nr:hypothetical protein BY996DRAFT_6413435 [Phakopsora pachyrhizi]